MARAWLRGAGTSLGDGTRPVVGICDTASDLNPCNVPLGPLAEEVAAGVWEAGGIPLRFPVISLGEPFVAPTTMMLRNLLAMDVEEMVRRQPLDAVVLLAGCDKTTPAMLMGAASADVPAILLVSGPMVPGTWHGQPIACGSDLRRFEEDRLAGGLDDADFADIEARAVTAPGTCAVMGTASTMAIAAEALGMSLYGSATAVATGPRRRDAARRTGQRAVQLAMVGPRPTEVLTAAAFANTTTILAAIGGSTNALLHLTAIGGRVGVSLSLDDFERAAQATPVLADVRPIGTRTVLEFEEAGGLSAIIDRLQARLDLSAVGVDGPLAAAARPALVDDVIRRLESPVTDRPWLTVLRGNLAPQGAVLKTAAAGTAHLVHRGPALVFDDRDELLALVADPAASVDPDVVMILRGIGPVGGPGMPEWGWWPVPASLLRRGIRDVVRISDGRMSGTAFGTVILHVAPEAAVGGPLAQVRTGDPIILNVDRHLLSVDLPDEELHRRPVVARPDRVPERGYARLHHDHVLPAPLGCDFDFLRRRQIGRGAAVER
jgi:dihydroxy-acid dehydratase